MAEWQMLGIKLSNSALDREDLRDAVVRGIWHSMTYALALQAAQQYEFKCVRGKKYTEIFARPLNERP